MHRGILASPLPPNSGLPEFGMQMRGRGWHSECECIRVLYARTASAKRWPMRSDSEGEPGEGAALTVLHGLC
jgi:hypothetical protein